MKENPNPFSDDLIKWSLLVYHVHNPIDLNGEIQTI